MTGRLSMDGDDWRNLAIVAVIVGLVMAVTTEGPIAVRLVVGAIAGIVSGATFLVVTAAIDAVKPDHW